MAVTSHNERPFGYKEYAGLSTDNKPTENVAINSMFFELDTGDFYYYTGETGEEWAKVGGGASAIENL